MPFDTIRMGSSAAGAYEIERSLRFNDPDSTYLTKDFGTATNRKIWTWSCWFKRARSGTSECWFSALAEDTTSWYSRFADNGNDNFEFTEYSGSSYVINLRPSMKLSDFSAWYHVVVAYDSTQGTASNRVKMYVNNVQITSFSTETYPSENQESGINKNHAHTIGKTTEGSSYYYGGNMADMYFVDGQQLTPSSFGETDVITGQWIPKKYGGTYGNNGFFLEFKDNSAATAAAIGKDTSGNGNNFTPHNFSVAAGVGDDSSLDTPTNNCCTFNTWDNGGLTVTNGGLDISGNTGDNHARAAWALPESGKYYWEVTATTVTAAQYQGFGIAHSTYNINTSGLATDGSKMYSANGKKYHDPDDASWGDTFDDGDVISIAVDMDAGKIWAAKNGTWQASGNPATGANPMYDNFLAYSTDKQWHPSFHSFQNGAVASFNFGQRAFAHTVPTGYGPLSVATIPEPTIKKGSDYFNTVLYTGNDSDGHAITGVGFQPNLVWIKDRGDGNHHRVYDSVRGVNAALVTSANWDEDQYATYGQFESFDSDGFTVGIGTGTSGQRGEATNSAEPHVAWCWKESATAGFDIVSYTGTGSSRTVSHNLGVAPEMIIIKNRDDDENWIVYHAGQASDAQTDYLILNDGSGIGGDDPWLNDTAPTSSQWEYSDGGNTYNDNGDDYIAYLFSSVEGYSKFGTYEGTGSTTGPFVYCGFRPAYIVTKRVETTPNAYWNVFDTARDPYNSGVTADFKRLLVHSSGAEATNHVNYTPPDILSNGFRLRHGSADKNYSGKRFIFFAFAETPFKYANAR